MRHDPHVTGSGAASVGHPGGPWPVNTIMGILKTGFFGFGKYSHRYLAQVQYLSYPPL